MLRIVALLVCTHQGDVSQVCGGSVMSHRNLAIEPRGTHALKSQPRIALIGAGGVRAPLFVQAAARRGFFEEIRLYDSAADSLARMNWICRVLLEHEGYPADLLTETTSLREALKGIDAAVVAVRPGGMKQRAVDEEAALGSGMIGQETVGVCGFAMAMRMLPALFDIVTILREASPDAWVLNFSNPVGITTLGLSRHGFGRIVGICDSANNALYAACRHLNLSPDDLCPETFGLNHLSWTRRILHEGRDLLPTLLQDELFVSRYQDLFFARDAHRPDLFLNEYLYYYLFPDEALRRMQAEPVCRGRYLAGLEAALVTALDTLRAGKKDEEALRVFLEYHGQRNATYMTYARTGQRTPEEASAGMEGYAGLALDVLEGFALGRERARVLIVPDSGSIPEVREEAAVEVTCTVSGTGVRPHLIDAVPEDCLELMRRVARYESMAVDAILEGDPDTMRQALCLNPLVGEKFADKAIEALELDSALSDARRRREAVSPR